MGGVTRMPLLCSGNNLHGSIHANLLDAKHTVRQRLRGDCGRAPGLTTIGIRNTVVLSHTLQNVVVLFKVYYNK